MDTAYHHEPLQTPRSLRILNLQPSMNSSEALRCSISQVSLDSKPTFEALSYVWGAKEPKRHVIVQTISQGCSRERTLVVTPNCAAALRRLRYRFRVRALWVDAICIDQTSIEDKNQQVPLMAQIYASATQVLVWLGEPKEGGDFMKSAFNVVRKAGSLYQMGLIRPHVDPAVKPPEIPLPHIRVSEAHIASEVRKHKGQMLEIYANPYWQRVWTVQEIALARKIVIISGSVEVNYPDFCVLTVFIDSNMSFFPDMDWLGRDVKVQRLVDHFLESHFVLLDADDLATLHRKGDGIVQEMEFPEQNILLGAKSLSASEPRDKVYAMLWAFMDAKEKDIHASLFKIDYEKPLDELFTEFTVFLLNHLEWEWKCWPMLLASEGRNAEKSSNIPSWVPDWEFNDNYYDLYAFGTRVSGLGIDDREDEDKILKFYVDGRYLHVWGMRYASVIAVFNFPNPLNTIDELDNDSEDMEPTAIYSLKIEALSSLNKIIEFFSEGDNDLDRHSFFTHLSRTLYTFDRRENMGLDDRTSQWTEHELELSKIFEIDPIIVRFRILDELLEIAKTMTGQGKPRLDQWLEVSSVVLSAYLSNEEVDACIEVAQEMGELDDLFAAADSVPENRALYDVAFLLEGLEDFINTNEIITLILTLHRGKSLFYTDRDKIGISFPVEFGDVISIWRGNHIPMIVRGRKLPDGEAGWTLVGPAYCDGVMFGEIQPKEEDIIEYILM